MTNFSANKIRSVIFDLDGTLLDSMMVWVNVDRDFLEENGKVYTPDVSEAVKKMTVTDSANYFRTRFDLDMTTDEIIDRIESMVSEKYRYTLPLKDGAFEAVKALHDGGIKMCVATATYNSLADAALKRLKIYDMLEFVITCHDAGAGKESPDIFLKAADMLGTLPEETAVAEDSLHCLQTAADAGFFTVGVYDHFSAHEKEAAARTADMTVNKLTELSDIILGK